MAKKTKIQKMDTEAKYKAKKNSQKEGGEAAESEGYSV